MTDDDGAESAVGAQRDEYECPDEDCSYVGPAGSRDYYGAHIYVCRRCGCEIPEADPDRLGGDHGAE